MRRRLPWLLALPVMAAGSLAAHSLSYLFLSVRGGHDGREVSERASTGPAAYVVLVLGLLAATALVAAAARLLTARRRPRAFVLSPWLFFVLPPLAFTSQEVAERLLGAEGFPFQAALEPRFLLGLLLQLPFGLLALFVARALLRIVERLVCALARAQATRLPTRPSWSPREARVLPRIPALALGHAQRGPPSL
jgi:hypothetical protein